MNTLEVGLVQAGGGEAGPEERLRPEKSGEVWMQSLFRAADTGHGSGQDRGRNRHRSQMVTRGVMIEANETLPTIKWGEDPIICPTIAQHSMVRINRMKKLQAQHQQIAYSLSPDLPVTNNGCLKI